MCADGLKKLWRAAFGDTEQYVDFYFSRRYRPENTRSRSAGGRVVSAAQFFPYNISFGGGLISGSYILGVCTHPDYRRRGFAAQIIRQILDEQAGAGADLAFLIPAEPYLFEVYGKLGFGGLFTVCEEHIPAGHIAAPAGYGPLFPSIDELFQFYDGFCRSLPSAALKTRDDFLFALDDLTVSGGRVDVCGANGKITGFAAAEGNTVKEMLCLNSQSRGALLSRILPAAGSGGLTVLSPANTPGTGATPSVTKKTLGMARVLRPKAFLEKTLKNSVTIYLTDGVFPRNTGVYSCGERGEVSFTPPTARGDNPDVKVDVRIDVAELPAYCMGEAYANFLLN